MASNVKLINEKLICTGDKIYTLIEAVTNKSLQTVTDIQVEVTPPPGVVYSSSNLAQGTYNSAENIWTIGTMTKGQTFSGEIAWKVTDDCLAPFKFDFRLTSAGPNVCINSGSGGFCIIIDGITKCLIDTYKRIKTINVQEDATLDLTDYTVLVDGSGMAINVTLPAPADAYRTFPDNSCNDGGKEYYIKVIDLTNPVTITTPSGKIVSFSTIADALDTFTFSLVGQTIIIHSNGENYFIKTV